MWGSWKTLKRVYWISLKYLRFFFPWFSWNWLVGIVGQCQYEGPSDMDYTTWRVQRTGKCFKVSHRWSKGLWKHRGLFGKKSEKKKDILSSEKPKIPSFFSTCFNCLPRTQPQGHSGCALPQRLSIVGSLVLKTAELTNISTALRRACQSLWTVNVWKAINSFTRQFHSLTSEKVFF